MKYLSFTIKQYRAISQSITVTLDKNTLVPIIGINECGKTTILHAIFAFDYHNDGFDENIRHLQDVNNLYKAGQKNEAQISANIKITWHEFTRILSSDEIKAEPGVKSYKLKKSFFTESLVITRNLTSRKYDIELGTFSNTDLNDKIARKILNNLPYILYFDDFRDSFPEEIEIRQEDRDKPTGWVAVIERLFEKTDKNFSIFDLEIDQRERKSIISRVQNKLNTTLTKEWQNFKLSESNALKINIEYTPKEISESSVKPAKIKFEILETDSAGEDHFFYIRDRSKGFFWFFNFVMKLEFNPKVISNEGVDAVYLLDEPGSYLHAAAQSKLCKKLKELSLENYVIYCTHSHYLLDPEIVPISTIKIAEKDKGNFNINLLSIYDHNPSQNKNAFQPVYDALQLKPFSTELSKNDKVIILEGIYDYYCLNMFVNNSSIKFIPSLGANSISYYISLMIGWNIPFNALWDNDIEGRREQQKAISKFGNDLSNKMLTLPLIGRQRNRIMQNLIGSNDMKRFKEELKINVNSSFEKTIATLYYSQNKKSILKKVTNETTKNFEYLMSQINI